MVNRLQTFFSSHRHEVVLFSAAFLLRAAAFLILSYIAISYSVLSANPEIRVYPVIGSDAGGYVGAARVLLEEHRFASPGETESQSYLMPGYPLLLAVIFFLGGGVKSVVVLQTLLAGLSAVLVYRIGKEIAPAVGSMAAWVFVFDPISIFYATTILTETVFVFLVLGGVYVFFWRFSSAWWNMALVGILIGLSVYIRPNAIVFPLIFFIALCVFRERAWTWKQTLLRGVVLGGVAFLIVFPWMLRNKLIFDTWDLTAVSTIQWYWYNAPLYYAYTHDITHTEALDIFHERLRAINPHQSNDGTLRNAPYMRQVAFEYLREDPFGYVWFHVVKSIPFFVSDGLRDIARRLEVVGDQPDIGGLLLRGDLHSVISFFREHTLAAVLLVAGAAFWGFVTLGMVAAIFLGGALSLASRRALYVSIGLIAVTILIAAGPNANARYRLSVSPFLFIAASYSFWVVLTKFRKSRTLYTHGSGVLET